MAGSNLRAAIWALYAKILQTNAETNTAYIHVLNRIMVKNRQLECNEIIKCHSGFVTSMCEKMPSSSAPQSPSYWMKLTRAAIKPHLKIYGTLVWWIVIPYHIPAKQWISAAASVPPKTLVECDVRRKTGNTYFNDWSGGVYVHCNCRSTSPHVQQGACCERVDYSLTSVGLG